MKKFPRSLFILLAIWLVIFIVPPLRWMNARQMQNSLWPLSWLFTQRLSQYHDLAKRYSNDARVWMMAAEEDYSPLSKLERSDEESDASFGAPLPPSGTITPSPLFPGAPAKDWNKEQWRRLDQIIARFPNQSWLIARRLRLTMGHLYSGRVGGELSDGNIIANRAAGKPSPERSTKPPDFSSQDLQRATALAKQGQKLEPDNAFFDWAETFFLVLAWRDGEAWQALDSAASKKVWDDHQSGEWKARIAARELLLGHSLLWQEKLQVLSATLYPQLARYREMARIISWQSIKAQRKGDHRTMLRLSGSLARVAAKMRDGSTTHIERLVAVAIEDIAISSPTYDARTQSGRRRNFNASFNSFILYAKKHGRRDLARWVASDAPKAASFRVGNTWMSNMLGGVSMQEAALIGALWQFAALILSLLPLALLGYCLMPLLMRTRRARSTLRGETYNDPLLKREIIAGALACGGIRALGHCLLAAGVLASAWLSMMFATGHIESVWDEITSWWGSLNTTAAATTGTGTWWAYVAYMMLGFYDYQGEFADQISSRFRWAMALVPILLGALWCAGRAAQKQKQWKAMQADEAQNDVERKQNHTFFSVLAAIASGRVFSSDFDFNWAQGAWTLVRWIAFVIFCGLWITFATWPQSEYSEPALIPLCIALFIFFGLLYEVFARWRGSTHRRRAASYGVRLLRESWLAWIVLGSTLYLLALLLSIPLRARADAQMDAFIEMGEVKAAQK